MRTLLGLVCFVILGGCSSTVAKSYIPVDSQLRPFHPPEELGAPIDKMPQPTSKPGEKANN
jgi:hypothetical protein